MEAVGRHVFSLSVDIFKLFFYFYFGVLHPVARTLSRLLEEPSLATTLQGVYFIFYIFLQLHVSALVGHLQTVYTVIL
jgi:hypothetical protein